MFSTVLRASIDSLSPENHAPTASGLSMLTTLRRQPKIRMPLFPGSGRDAEGVQLTRFFHWLACATCGWETRKPETANAMRETFHLLLSPSSSVLPSPIRPFTYLRNPKAGESIVFSRLFDSLLATGKHPATYPLLLVGLARPTRADRLVTGSTGQFVRFVRFLGLQTGPDPTDRAELGSKRHLICHGQGGFQQGKHGNKNDRRSSKEEHQ